MTPQEKQQITVMRNSGKSYNTTVRELNITVNSIKPFCRRNHLGGVRMIGGLPSDVSLIPLIRGIFFTQNVLFLHLPRLPNGGV